MNKSPFPDALPTRAQRRRNSMKISAKGSLVVSRDFDEGVFLEQRDGGGRFGGVEAACSRRCGRDPGLARGISRLLSLWIKGTFTSRGSTPTDASVYSCGDLFYEDRSALVRAATLRIAAGRSRQIQAGAKCGNAPGCGV